MSMTFSPEKFLDLFARKWPELLEQLLNHINATTLALLCQNVGQKYTDPSSAAVLLSLEAPFGVAFSVLFGAEQPTGFMYFGFFLIFVAVVCSETKFDFLRKKKTAA